MSIALAEFLTTRGRISLKIEGNFAPHEIAAMEHLVRTAAIKGATEAMLAVPFDLLPDQIEPPPPEDEGGVGYRDRWPG